MTEVVDWGEAVLEEEKAEPTFMDLAKELGKHASKVEALEKRIEKEKRAVDDLMAKIKRLQEADDDGS